MFLKTVDDKALPHEAYADGLVGRLRLHIWAEAVKV